MMGAQVRISHTVNIFNSIWLLLFCVIVHVRCQCPPVSGVCTCAPSIYEPVSIVCDGAGSLQNALQAISAARDVQIDSLAILNTPISRLQAYSFQGFNIIRLVLNNNGLTNIDNAAFDSSLTQSLLELDLKNNALGQVPQSGVAQLQNLRKLYLSRNRIRQLPSNVFASYASREMLLKLDLSGNQISDSDLGGSFGTGPFSPLINLEELSLEANALNQIPTGPLRALKNSLTDLNLGLNQINNVPAGALDFPKLESLSLEFNGIKTLPPESLRLVPNLLYLYITGNKFQTWIPEMFRYVGQLQILGIGETPITVIPANAFQFIPRLIRLEMSEAAVDTIQPGAFQVTGNIAAIILNKNRLTRIRQDMFAGLTSLYTLDLQGNQLNFVEDFAFANLPALRHLDISSNNLETLTQGTFQNTFLPTADARVLYSCDNPWVCDERLAWFRQFLRDNLDINIDKPGCPAICVAPDFFPPNWPLRNPDPPRPSTPFPVVPTPGPLRGSALGIVGWIILAVILAILLTSICLLAIIRYFVSRRRKKDKDEEEEEEQRIISSTASGYHPASIAPSAYPASAVDLDLPPAHSLDDRPALGYWAY